MATTNSPTWFICPLKPRGTNFLRACQKPQTSNVTHRFPGAFLPPQICICLKEDQLTHRFVFALNFTGQQQLILQSCFLFASNVKPTLCLSSHRFLLVQKNFAHINFKYLYMKHTFQNKFWLNYTPKLHYF